MPIEERPPIPSEADRVAARAEKKAAKDGRRALRREADAAERTLGRIEAWVRQAEKEIAMRTRRMGVTAGSKDVD